TNSVEGVISLQSNAAFAASIGSSIAGRGTVTVSGNNSNSLLVLAGANPFTNLVVNNVKVGFSADTNLGNGTVTLVGGTLSNLGTVTVARNVALGSGGGAIEVPAANNATYTGVISGAQNLTKSGLGRLI